MPCRIQILFYHPIWVSEFQGVLAFRPFLRLRPTNQPQGRSRYTMQCLQGVYSLSLPVITIYRLTSCWMGQERVCGVFQSFAPVVNTPAVGSPDSRTSHQNVLAARFQSCFSLGSDRRHRFSWLVTVLFDKWQAPSYDRLIGLLAHIKRYGLPGGFPTKQVIYVHILQNYCSASAIMQSISASVLLYVSSEGRSSLQFISSRTSSGPYTEYKRQRSWGIGSISETPLLKIHGKTWTKMTTFAKVGAFNWIHPKVAPQKHLWKSLPAWPERFGTAACFVEYRKSSKSPGLRIAATRSLSPECTWGLWKKFHETQISHENNHLSSSFRVGFFIPNIPVLQECCFRSLVVFFRFNSPQQETFPDLSAKYPTVTKTYLGSAGYSLPPHR